MCRLLLITWFVIIGIVAKSVSAWAVGQDDVERLIQADAAPIGVVFEVVTAGTKPLQETLGRIQDWSAALRQRFDGLQVSVVSHGAEQFSLTAEALEREPAVISLLESLKNDQIPVMVCGNHGAIRGVEKDAWPQIVSVVDAAPAAIDDFRERGHTIIVIYE